MKGEAENMRKICRITPITGFCFGEVYAKISFNEKKGVKTVQTCVIMCAGEFTQFIRQPAEGDYLLAADGGLTHLQNLGLRPDGILGDFDSLGYIPQGAEVFPVEKDDTDSMLAVRQGLALGYRHFELYGALDGPRLDHTLANLQTLQFLASHGAGGHLIGLNHVVSVVSNGTLTFPETARGIVSVFCMGPQAKGVTIRGLQYGLENGSLSWDFPLGVSNHFVGRPASVRVEDGTLLVVYDTANGLAEGERHGLE